MYRHDTSRELDPQLHTHAVAANLTYDGVEGRWKALQASGLYERRAYLTEVYRNALAQRGARASATKLSSAAIPVAGISVLRFAAYQMKCWSDIASEAHSETQPLKNSKNSMAGSRQITKWPSWSENRARTSSRRLRRNEVRQQQQARLSPAGIAGSGSPTRGIPGAKPQRLSMNSRRRKTRCNTQRSIFSSGAPSSTITNC